MNVFNSEVGGILIGQILHYSILVFSLLILTIVAKILNESSIVDTFPQNIFKAKNKSKNLWLELLRENKKIDDYLIQFRNIKKNENMKGSITSNLIATAIFILLYFSLLFIFESKFDFWTSMAYISLMNFIPYIALIFIARYINFTLDPEKILKKSAYIVNLIDSTTFYLLLSNTIIAFTILLLKSKLKIPIQINDPLTSMFELSIVLFIVTLWYLVRIRRNFINSIKSAINIKINNECSPITVITNRGEINGNIKDIFNDEVILLDYQGHNNIVQWEDITGLYIHEDKHAPT